MKRLLLVLITLLTFNISKSQCDNEMVKAVGISFTYNSNSSAALGGEFMMINPKIILSMGASINVKNSNASKMDSTIDNRLLKGNIFADIGYKLLYVEYVYSLDVTSGIMMNLDGGITSFSGLRLILKTGDNKAFYVYPAYNYRGYFQVKLGLLFRTY